MPNEVYAKLICQNLTSVILSQIELGIKPAFWKEVQPGTALAV
jgi:hypothetical protein